MLVFDITKKNTFDLINNWVDDINKMDIEKILIGNKANLKLNREVSREEGEKLGEKLECQYYETSTLNGENINTALKTIAKTAYLWKNFKKYKAKNSYDNSRKKGCC